MALPKRKHGQARRDKRRSHLNVRLGGLTRCPQCASPMLSHRVCRTCGFYRGRHVLTIAAKEDKPKA